MNIHIEILMFEPETEETYAHQLYMSETTKCESVPEGLLCISERVPKSASYFFLLFFFRSRSKVSRFQRIASKIKIISFFLCVIKQENTDKKITQRHPWPKKKSQLKYRRQRTHRCSHAENNVDINQLIYKNMHRWLKSQTYRSHSLRCNATTVPQVASNYKRRS